VYVVEGDCFDLQSFCDPQSPSTQTHAQLTHLALPPHHHHLALETDAGFTDMLRVGALARIARPLLRFSLHSGDDSRDALSQLNAMLPEARGSDAELIR